MGMVGRTWRKVSWECRILTPHSYILAPQSDLAEERRDVNFPFFPIFRLQQLHSWLESRVQLDYSSPGQEWPLF